MERRGITRRGLLGGAAAGAAVASVPAAASARTSGPRRYDADVVVVGAGLAGLMAARQLVGAGKSAVVVEARDRVGGRVVNLHVRPGVITEGGAEFIGPTQDRIAALARAVGVRTFKTYDVDNYLYYRNGVGTPYNGRVNPVPPDPTGAAEGAAALLKLDQMAGEVPLDAPWTAPHAEEWDSQTVQTWREANVHTSGGRVLFDVAVRAVFSAEPRDLSLLFALTYIAGAGDEHNKGSFVRLISTGGGAQESRFVGGSQLVPIRVAQRLGRHVVLGSPVRRISQNAHGVRVEGDGFVATGQRAIVAIPPPLAGRLEYAPKLPALRDQLTQRFPMGSVIKVHAIYDRPFWRDKKFNGQVVSDTGPVQATFDNSPPSGKPGILMGFIEATSARRLTGTSRAHRRALVLENYAKYFGDQARHAIGYLERTWDDETWTRGCPVAFTAPGVLLDYGTAIRKPVGRIHWAGTETSTYWNGYMDGAVRSGERAAAEVARLLHGHRPFTHSSGTAPRRAPRFTG